MNDFPTNRSEKLNKNSLEMKNTRRLLVNTLNEFKFQKMVMLSNKNQGNNS